MTIPTKARVLLLIEDNDRDAELILEGLLLGDDAYEVLRAATMEEATTKLKARAFDVVTLDLRLPDARGLDAIRSVRTAAPDVPVVVLTGTDDDAVALACIAAGAQDYLLKSELKPYMLRRALGYAISRLRERQVRELEETLAQYRNLSSASQGTSVTAALAGSGAIALRSPEKFASLVDAYAALLDRYVDPPGRRGPAPRGEQERVATALGDAGAGPRDLLDVHVGALDRVLANPRDPRSRGLVLEARLLALEMMGLLVDYYRVGQRRRFLEGSATR